MQSTLRIHRNRFSEHIFATLQLCASCRSWVCRSIEMKRTIRPQHWTGVMARQHLSFQTTNWIIWIIKTCCNACRVMVGVGLSCFLWGGVWRKERRENHIIHVRVRTNAQKNLEKYNHSEQTVRTLVRQSSSTNRSASWLQVKAFWAITVQCSWKFKNLWTNEESSSS